MRDDSVTKSVIGRGERKLRGKYKLVNIERERERGASTHFLSLFLL